ncbi:MAG: efflux RND transporter periplasmic adaptor subunit [Gemmatimonadota bacterium]
MSRSHIPRTPSVAWALFALTTFAGCKSKAPPPAPPPTEVVVFTVGPQSIPELFEFSGEVQPFRRVEVRSRIDGILEARPFTEGSNVRPGDVLYRLERVRPEAAYQSALARSQNAHRILDRLEPLVSQNAVAQIDVDNARAEAQTADATLAEAKKNLDDTVIHAEIAGRVGRTMLDVGARVTGPADLLTTIDVLDPVYVSFRPSSQQLLQWNRDPRSRAMMRAGSQLLVEVALPDGTLLPRPGKLDFVAPSLDSTTGTQEFRATFSNPDRMLSPGQFVKVRLHGLVRDSALAIPQRAVQQSLGRQFVFVVTKGDSVAARDIQPGPWSGNLWIIDKGLAAGDRVIVDGIQKVGPGSVVHPVPLTDTTAAAGATPAPNRSVP